MKQGVAIMGRNTTGPPSHAAPWWVTLYVCHRGVLQTTDAREQNNTAPTLCAGGPVIIPSLKSDVTLDECWIRLSLTSSCDHVKVNRHAFSRLPSSSDVVTDGSRVGRNNQHLFIFPHGILKTNRARMNEFDIEMFNRESWNPIYLFWSHEAQKYQHRCLHSYECWLLLVFVVFVHFSVHKRYVQRSDIFWLITVAVHSMQKSRHVNEIQPKSQIIYCSTFK